eukprot:4111976-Amphidinium_carterae.2
MSPVVVVSGRTAGSLVVEEWSLKVACQTPSILLVLSRDLLDVNLLSERHYLLLIRSLPVSL